MSSLSENTNDAQLQTKKLDQQLNSNRENKENISNTLVLNSSLPSNPLEYAYSFWFSKRPSKNSAANLTNTNNTQNTNYDANLRLVGTFNSVEKFWELYGHMTRPHDILGHADIHLFKDGIRPLWEDDANKNGGKWIVRLKKGLANRCWENLILAILGEQFMVGEEICGAVVSVRYQVSLKKI